MLHVSYYLLYDYAVCLTTLSVQLHTVSNLPRLSSDSWLMARRWLVLIRSWRVTVLFCDSQSWCASARGLVVGASASALVGRESASLSEEMLHVSYYLSYDYAVCLTTLSVQLHTVSNLPRLSGDSWLMARRWLVLIRSWRVTVLFCDSQSWCAPARGLVVGASASALVGREFDLGRRELIQYIKTSRVQLKPEIVQTQSWCYKTIVVLNRQQPTTVSRSGNWTFAAATLHTFRSDRRKHPVTKVAERCIFKSRPWITSAQRLSTTPNSRLYDPLKAEILQSQFHVRSQKKLLTPRRCMSFGLCILRQVFCLQHQSQHNCLMPQCPAKHSLEVPGF